jgi:hypothetical protein
MIHAFSLYESPNIVVQKWRSEPATASQKARQSGSQASFVRRSASPAKIFDEYNISPTSALALQVQARAARVALELFLREEQEPKAKRLEAKLHEVDAGSCAF